jgi:hypothetical protein
MTRLVISQRNEYVLGNEKRESREQCKTEYIYFEFQLGIQNKAHGYVDNHVRTQENAQVIDAI